MDTNIDLSEEEDFSSSDTTNNISSNREIGDLIVLDEVSRNKILSAQQDIYEFQRLFGHKREEYLRIEARLYKEINNAQKAYRNTVNEIAQEKGIDVENTTARWHFDPDNMTYARL